MTTRRRRREGRGAHVRKRPGAATERSSEGGGKAIAGGTIQLEQEQLGKEKVAMKMVGEERNA